MNMLITKRACCNPGVFSFSKKAGHAIAEVIEAQTSVFVGVVCKVKLGSLEDRIVCTKDLGHVPFHSNQ